MVFENNILNLQMWTVFSSKYRTKCIRMVTINSDQYLIDKRQIYLLRCEDIHYHSHLYVQIWTTDGQIMKFYSIHWLSDWRNEWINGWINMFARPCTCTHAGLENLWRGFLFSARSSTFPIWWPSIVVEVAVNRAAWIGPGVGLSIKLNHTRLYYQWKRILIV